MGKAARQASRERLRQEREKAKKRAQRNKILGVIGAALAVVLVIVGAGYLYYTADDGSGSDIKLPPQALQQDGSVVLAKEGAKAPVVEVYADFQCPACQQFETENADALKQLAADGKAIVHYRPVSIFAQQPPPIGTNSLRAGAAARAAADHGKFVQYNDILFENQPPEGQEGFSVEDLKKWGKDVGIDDLEFAKRVEAEAEVAKQFGDYSQQLVQKAQSQFSQQQLQTMQLGDLMKWGEEQGIDSSFVKDTYVGELINATQAVSEKYAEKPNAFSGTPSVYVNGQKLGNQATFSESALTDAIESAKPGEVDTKPADSSGQKADPSPDAKE